MNSFDNSPQDFPRASILDSEYCFALEKEATEFGINRIALAGVFDGDKGSIDELSFQILELLKAREVMKRNGRTHSQSRKEAISDSLVNTLIILMLESCQAFQVCLTSSLVALSTEMLGGQNTDRKKRHESERTRDDVALNIADNPDISNRELGKLWGIDHSTISRWRHDDKFQRKVQILQSALL